MINLNYNYKFYNYYWQNRYIYYCAESSRKFNNIRVNDIILEYIFDNTDYIKVDIIRYANNDNFYKDYLKRLYDMHSYKKYEYYPEMYGVSYNNFIRYENQLFNSYKLQPLYQISITVKVYYQSDSGRVYRENYYTYYGNDLIYLYNQTISRESKKIFAEIERSKMSSSLRVRVLERDNYRCRICGASSDIVELEVDHIIPVSKGGKTELSNLQTLCRDCNRGKSTRILKQKR